MAHWISIYTTSAFECKYCDALKKLLQVYGYDYYEKDIFTEERYKREFMERGFKTVPQVYVEGTLIGGYSTTKDYLRNKFFKDHPRKEKIIQQLKELDSV